MRSRYHDERLTRFEALLNGMRDKGLVEWNESCVRLTPIGMLLSNEVFQEFV